MSWPDRESEEFAVLMDRLRFGSAMSTRRCGTQLENRRRCRHLVGPAGRCSAGHVVAATTATAAPSNATAVAAHDPLASPQEAAFAAHDPEQIAAGGMLGVHVGDSLGATAEFKSRAVAASLYPSRVDDVNITGGGAFKWSPGDATDDTDLTAAVDAAYANGGATDDVVRAAADNMLDWYRGKPVDVGGATAEGLQRYAKTGDPYTSGVTRDSGQGNGSLMRTLPVALARANDPERRADEARKISAITHAHPVCEDACVAYSDLAADLATRRVSNPQQLDQRLEELANDERFDPSVRKAIRDGIELDHISDLPREQDGSGWVNYSMTVAVWAARQRRPAADVLLDVVRHGGDSDTNGAIAGGILGLRDGADAWPKRWTDKLQMGKSFRDAGRDYSSRWS